MNEANPLAGYGLPPSFVAAPAPTNQRPNPGGAMDENVVLTVDGTPVRVVVLALAAAAGLTALKWAGFRFNVGVST